MSNIISRLFGTDTVVNKTIDTVKHVVDEAFYTKEEQTADQRAGVTEGRQFMIRWLEATSPSRLARRVLAFAITFAWLFMYILAAGLDFAAIWFTDEASRLVASSALIDQRAERMNGAVMIILGFYFAGPYVGDLVKPALNRFGGQGNL